MPSPPKPWERASTTAALSSSSPQPQPSTSSSSSSAPPAVPTRPPALASTPSPASAFSSGYNTSPYAAPYSRFGSGYSPYGANSMYGGAGYSSYGGMGYGGIGGGYGGGMGGYGYGGMGMGMYGGAPGMPPPGFDPSNPSLTQTLESTTQHTFALLHSIVQTFSGVAQMLESTFMATHSSFFAMVGVIDQFGQLRNALGSVLGLFGLVRWMKDLLTGNRAGTAAMRGEFREFVNGRPVHGPLLQHQQQPKASKKPLIMFLLAIFGVPYAMHKLVRILTERHQQQLAAGQDIPGALPPLDPSQLTFARALYPFEASSPAEIALKENEIVAIMGKLDPSTGAEVDPRIEVEGSEWWKGRTRDGREGWFPKKWVQVLERRKPVEGGGAEEVKKA